ncbi:MAG TPA: ABC transporter permease [Candidatus Methylomirabilis sp.]|nr:ABC transporter permease [Candidatus Methylomirabilis sp.]
MTLWRRFRSWLGATVRRPRLESEMDAELCFHIQSFADDLIRKGVPEPEALRRARLEFGGVERTKEECREARGVSFTETFLQDVRFGARMLRKNPGFTAVAALTLALGIGANTAIFSLVNGILLVSLPYRAPEQLVTTTGTYPRGVFVALRQQIRAMDVATYAEGHDFNLTGQGEPVRLSGTYVSAELFSLLGTQPEFGGTFMIGEDLAGQDSYVILSHALWQERFRSDPTIIGRSIVLEGASREVVGVMPATFRFPSAKTQIWIPLHNDSRSVADYWAGDFMPIIGRLHPGATLEQARAEIRLFQSHVGALFPWPMPATWNADISVIPLQNGMVANVRLRLLVLLAAVALVLLIACTNLANLMLSRAAIREKEVAIRAALGAGRSRIFRQLLTESVVLASVGALGGLLFAAEGLRLLKTLLPADTPRLFDVHMDWRVLAFTAVLALLTGIAFGLAPALRSSRAALTESLNSGGRGASVSVSQRLRSGLVIAEVAFAVLLVIAAGLMIRSFWALSHVNPGFQPEHMLTARLTPNEALCSDPSRCVAFYRNLLAQLQPSPGVRGVALVNTLPLDGRVAKRSFDVENHVVPPGEDSPLFWLNIVTPDYFRVMNIPLLAGRSFADSDLEGAPVAIVTAETARRFWPNQGAVGKHIRLLNDKDWRTIIGVIPDVRAYDLEHASPDWMTGTAYILYDSAATLENQRVPADMTIAIRTVSGDSLVATELRKTVASLNHEVPVSELKPMGAIVSDAAAAPASTTSLFVIFAAVALALGVIGIYGVLSYLVAKRTREIGIRLALGAQRRDVLLLIMKEGAKFSLAGIVIGLLAAFAVTRLLSSELYGVSSTDPLTYFAVALLMAAVTLLACYIPTRRATRVDPLTALRQD